MNEIQRPSGIRPRLDQNRGTCAESLAPRTPLADGQPFLTVESIDAVDP